MVLLHLDQTGGNLALLLDEKLSPAIFQSIII